MTLRPHGAAVTALARARQQDRIANEFHHMIAVNPDHAEDSAWLITATAYTLGEDEQDVRRIWDARFRDHGVA